MARPYRQTKRGPKWPGTRGYAQLTPALRKAYSTEMMGASPSTSSDEGGDSLSGGVKLVSKNSAASGFLKAASDSGQDMNASPSAFREACDEDDVFSHDKRDLPFQSGTHKGKSTSSDNTSAPQSSAGDLVHQGECFGDADEEVFRSPHPVDPQALYPPAACIFVANLCQSQEDAKLEEEVTRAFSQFGIVFTKIKRDRRGMPFAFCQFTEIRAAENALIHGKAIFILGRQCRTEMCNGNLNFIVYKRNRETIEPHEAASLLRPFGQIASAEHLDEVIQRKLRLPQAIFVIYETFNARRDPIKSIGRHSVYMVMAYDPRAVDDTTEEVQAPTFMERYDKDRRSAFFGNMPPFINEEWVMSLASGAGEVLEIQLKETSNPVGPVTRFAFVEFERGDAPDKAAMLFNGKDLEGYRIRVERKRPRMQHATPQKALPPAHLGPHSSAPGQSYHRRGPSAISTPRRIGFGSSSGDGLESGAQSSAVAPSTPASSRLGGNHTRTSSWQRSFPTRGSSFSSRLAPRFSSHGYSANPQDVAARAEEALQRREALRKIREETQSSSVTTNDNASSPIKTESSQSGAPSEETSEPAATSIETKEALRSSDANFSEQPLATGMTPPVAGPMPGPLSVPVSGTMPGPAPAPQVAPTAHQFAPPPGLNPVPQPNQMAPPFLPMIPPFSPFNYGNMGLSPYGPVPMVTPQATPGGPYGYVQPPFNPQMPQMPQVPYSDPYGNVIFHGLPMGMPQGPQGLNLPVETPTRGRQPGSVKEENKQQ